MKIGIVGCGTVGQATARCYLEYADVLTNDIVKERATHTLTEVALCDLVFVCLPTPQRAQCMQCDTKSLDEFFSCVSSHWPDQNYVLRSTVPVGYTRAIAQKYELPNLVHSPEFLTSRCAIADAMMPARNIIGVPWDNDGETDRAKWLKKNHPLISLYQARFPGTQCLVMNSDESELVKLSTNAFFSVKIAFFNELRALSDKLCLDWKAVLAGIMSDGRISHSHTKVPGPDGRRGFGGECLPKDLCNLIHCYWQNSVQGGAKMLCAAQERNEFDRRNP